MGWALVGSIALVPGWAGSGLANEAEALPAPGIAAPYCPDESQQGLNRCAGQWLKTAEYFEQLVYADLVPQLELPLRVQLASAEEHWRVFRMTECRLVSEPFIGGSIHPLIYASCLAIATNDRTADLQEWGDSTLSVQEASDRLTTLLKELDWADNEAQSQWEAYRDQHCTFEASYHPDQPDQYEQCLSRLTTTRILRLEALNPPR